MNRKFVKENKHILREFIAGIVAAVIGAKGSRDINKMIDKNPVLKAKRTELRADVKALEKKIQDYVKKNPHRKAAMQKAFSDYM